MGALVAVAVWKGACRSFDDRSALIAGATVGLACALKLVFMPWIAALLVAAWVCTQGPVRARAIVLCLAGVAAAFLVSTLPAAANYPEIAGWIGRLATRSGAYGETAQLLPDAATLAASALSMLAAAKAWYGLVLLSAVGAVMAIRHARATLDRRQLAGLGLFAITAFVVQHLMVIRTPSLRYLVPTAVCGVLLVAIASQGPALQRRPAAQWAALLVIALLLGKHIWRDLTTHQDRIRVTTAARTELVAAVRAASHEACPVVVYGHRAPVPSLALRYFATDPVFLAQVERQYPGEGHLGPGGRAFLPGHETQWDVLVLNPRNTQDATRAAGARLVNRVGELVVLVPDGRRPAPGGATHSGR